VLPIAALARDGDQRIANLRKLATMAATRAQERRQPLADVVRELIDRQTRVDGDSESSLADEDVDAVRILTIHKAKGLEFDVVFVGDLAAKSSGSHREPPTVARVPLADGVRLAVHVPALKSATSRRCFAPSAVACTRPPNRSASSTSRRRARRNG
jgi:ATP-dependent exoDNAse (exonuclease V) beta subunit